MIVSTEGNVGIGTMNPVSLLDVNHMFNVLSGGNVGIGTTSPGAKLHVAGTPGTDGIMFPDGTLQKTAANGGGTVTGIAGGTGLTGGTMTTSGTLALATSGVTAGTYSRATVSVDSYGRLVSASSGPSIVNADISATAAIDESKIANLTADLASKQAALAVATSIANGYLASSDWLTFNNKQSSLGYTPLNKAGD